MTKPDWAIVIFGFVCSLVKLPHLRERRWTVQLTVLWFSFQPFLEIREGRHPCICRTFSGGDFIPNDTIVGIADVWNFLYVLNYLSNMKYTHLSDKQILYLPAKKSPSIGRYILITCSPFTMLCLFKVNTLFSGDSYSPARQHFWSLWYGRVSYVATLYCNGIIYPIFPTNQR